MNEDTMNIPVSGYPDWLITLTDNVGRCPACGSDKTTASSQLEAAGFVKEFECLDCGATAC